MGFLREHFGPSRAEIWRQFAAQVGGQFVSGGLWQPDHVVARCKEWTLTLDTYTEPVGRAPVTYTRLRAPYVNQDGFRFVIYRQGLFSRIAKHLGMQDVIIGDPAFDERFILQGNDAAKLRALLADTLLRQLIAYQSEFCLEVKDDEGWFGAHFPAGVDELCFQVIGDITNLDRLKALYDLFAETLDQLCRIGSAYAQDPQTEIS